VGVGVCKAGMSMRMRQVATWLPSTCHAAMYSHAQGDTEAQQAPKATASALPPATALMAESRLKPPAAMKGRVVASRKGCSVWLMGPLASALPPARRGSTCVDNRASGVCVFVCWGSARERC
jgi:hypothetical protein